MRKTVSIKKKLEVEEAMHCWRKGCKEELNGLMHHWIDMGDGFIFDMWLCGGCTRNFKGVFREFQRKWGWGLDEVQ